MNKPSFERDLSLVIPVFNEEPNLRPLLAEIHAALDPTDLNYEIVCVDDGSTDGSAALLHDLHESDPRLVVVRFRRNYGQTAAFAAGFNQAAGAVVVTLDADLQNSPHDIPALLAKLDEGYDVVNGWRVDRQDGYWLRLVPSRIANRLIARSTGVKLHDRGCSLRAFRADVVADLRLYGELHRFIPELVSQAGYTMAEVPVSHQPRTAGQSKYGLSRTFRVLLDLMTIVFIRRYGDRPMHLFGSVGLICGALGFLVSFVLSVQKIWAGVRGGWDGFNAFQLSDRPLLLLGVLLIIIGTQFFAMGLVAELQVRTYYESQGKPVYQIRQEERARGGS